MGEWKAPKEPVALSGGNPQVPKGDGDAPVRYFIEHMPDRHRKVGERLDALITETVPDVQKGVRWNSAFYGAGKGWILSVHCFTDYVKVTFFRGARLDPPPPETFKDPDARAVHIGGDGTFDEARFTEWVAQAAAMPGWNG